MKPATLHGLQVGWHVAVALREPVAGLACYVGEIQTLDEFGLRLTLVDWLTGAFSNWDHLIPWTNVLGAEVCTDKHDLQGWNPGRFQTRHEEARRASAETPPPSRRGPGREGRRDADPPLGPVNTADFLDDEVVKLVALGGMRPRSPSTSWSSRLPTEPAGTSRRARQARRRARDAASRLSTAAWPSGSTAGSSSRRTAASSTAGSDAKSRGACLSRGSGRVRLAGASPAPQG
ncbi:MAG: hypothetical protein U0599_29085 [Vicinamibacteria bacterium]